MAAGDAVDFKWYQYTDDNAVTWSVKVDKLWGDNADSGLGAFSATDQVFPSGGRFRLRKVLLQDAVSGRRTQRVLGTAAATAGTPGTSVAVKVRGAAGTVAFTSLGIVPERKPKAGTIINKAEPIAA